MKRWYAGAALGVLLLAGGLPGFDAAGTLKKVDADKRQIVVHANGKDRTLTVAKDAKVLGEDGKPLKDGLAAKELAAGADVTVTVERADGGPVVTAVRLGKKGAAAAGPTGGKESLGLKPLTEMTAEDRYKGEDGGLYGGGRNDPPAEHAAAAKAAAGRVVPRGPGGDPAADGKVVLVSLSMSNATQEFSVFKRLADADKEKAGTLTVVDCAQGGQAMAQWADPKGKPWAEADRRLAAAKVSPAQVQVAWVKLANVAPSGDLPEHGKKLYADTLAVLKNARAKFPNLQLVYLGSRIYAGYATGRLNPEPFAYESAFVARWLVRDQIAGKPELAADRVPVVLWGPYLWADGTTPRKADGLVWERADFVADGVHPSPSGRQKVAELLLKFFKTDPTAKPWFAKK